MAKRPGLTDEQRIRLEIERIERKRDRANKDKCPFVAAKHQREINALLSELDSLLTTNK